MCVTAELGYCNSAPETSKQFAFVLDEEYRLLILSRELYWIVPQLSKSLDINCRPELL